MTLAFRVRQSTLGDIPKLLEFEQGVIAAERPFDKKLKEGAISYYDLESLVTSDDSELVVAEYKQQLIGSGYAQIRESKPYVKNRYFSYLGFMYVDPAFRGMSVNKRILEALFEWSSSRDIDTVSLDVYEQNQAAIRAYEKVGFRKSVVQMEVELDNCRQTNSLQKGSGE